MTRLALPLALALVAPAGCDDDSSTHSHDGKEHSHADEDAGDEKKPADPPTKEVTVADPAPAAVAKPEAENPADAAAEAKPAKADGKPAEPGEEQGGDHHHGDAGHTHE